MSSSDRKPPEQPLRIVPGTGAGATEGRLADLREASKGYEPLDLDGDSPENLGADGQWLWKTLGTLLLERGYLTAVDFVGFAILCECYERRADPEWEAELRAWMEKFAVTAQLLRDLEAARGAKP